MQYDDILTPDNTGDHLMPTLAKTRSGKLIILVVEG